MKKVLSIILMLVVLLTFSACTGSDIGTTDTSQDIDISGLLTNPFTPSETTEVVEYTVDHSNDFTETTEIGTTAVSTIRTEEEESIGSVRLVIDCSEINSHYDKLAANKAEFVPADGIILEKSVPIYKGDTVFDVLRKGCADNSCKAHCGYCNKGISVEYSYSPMYKSYYVEGIHQLYEFDCGPSSGWLYMVNGKYPDISSSERIANSGDVIVFQYTCTGVDFQEEESTTDYELPPF